MLRKQIKVTFQKLEFELECDPEMGIAIMRVEDFVENEEKSTPDCTYYESKNIIEAYPEIDELKEIVKAMQQIIEFCEEKE